MQFEQKQMAVCTGMVGPEFKLPPLKIRKAEAARLIELELKAMQTNPSDDFKCLALESNPYDWQFAIRGPNLTEFQGGIYHGRIQFSEEYPDKPPIFTLLTENGRFKTQTEIDLGYFFWKTFTGVRDALHRLIELLPTYPDGALGSVEYDKKQRRALAIKSREAAPRYGTAERQKLIDEIHEYMLSKVPPVPSNGGGDIPLSSQNDRDRRKQGKRIYNIIGNIIKSIYSKQTGVFDFDHTKKRLHLHSLALENIEWELKTMQSKPSDDFKCLALTENPYDWQFAIRGPNGTEFEGGIYHGRIQFSEERPDKPPIFTLLTENGRFKTQTEICFERSFSLSLRGRGPVKVREALLRLIELLPTYPDGALGSVEYDKEQRRALAIKSREAAPRYDTSERQKLIDEIHEYMLSKVPPVPSNGGGDIRLSSQNDRDGRQQDMVTKKRKRKQDINLIIGNTIIADSCKQVGIFDIGKRVKSPWWWS